MYQGNKPNSLVFFGFYHNDKINFNKLDETFSNPFHWACYSAAYECVDFLLEKKQILINIQSVMDLHPNI